MLALGIADEIETDFEVISVAFANRVKILNKAMGIAITDNTHKLMMRLLCFFMTFILNFLPFS